MIYYYQTINYIYMEESMRKIKLYNQNFKNLTKVFIFCTVMLLINVRPIFALADMTIDNLEKQVMNEVNDEVSNKMMSIWGWVFGIFIIVAIAVGGFKYYFSHKNLLYVRKNKKNDDKKEDSDLS